MKTFHLLVGCLGLSLFATTSALAAPPEKWKQISSEKGIRVYSKKMTGSALIGFKGVAVIDAPIHKVFSVLMDNKRRTEWVDRLKSSKILQRYGPHDFVIYQHFEAPPLVSDRDYVYRGRASRNSDGVVMLKMWSVAHHKEDQNKTGVRAKLMSSAYVLVPMGKKKTWMSVEIHTDPKGMIPTSIVNMIQKTWPVKTLTGIKKQVKKKVELYPFPPVKPEATSVKASSKKNK